MEVDRDRELSGFQLAPDGQLLSFVLQRHKRTQVSSDRKKVEEIAIADLCTLQCDGGYPRPLTDCGDVTRPAVWSPTGEWLAFERDKQLHIMPALGGAANTIYEGPLYHPPLETDDDPLGYPRWSPDGSSLLFATRTEARTALRIVRADGGQQRELISIEGYIIGWDWSPDGRRVLLVTRDDDGWVGDVRTVDVDSGTSCVLWPERHYEYRKPAAVWTLDGNRIVFRSNRSGWAKLWVSSSDGRDVRPLTLGEWDEYAFRLSADGMRVVYASRSEQSGSTDDLWMISLEGGEPSRLTRHVGVNAPVACSRDGRVYYWHSSPTEPGDLWMTTLSGAVSTRMTWSAPINLERKLRAPREVIVTNDDGTQVPALIYLPAHCEEGQRFPAIVWIRGGPTDVCRFDFAPLCNWLANEGFVVITPNYRGSIGYGVKHMEAVAGDGLGKNDLSDVLTVGRYVRTLPYVDLTRGVGVGGRSWGGYLTLMAATQAPNDFSCAVAGAAISDWSIQQANTEVRYYDRWLVGGWVYEQPDRVMQRSPVNFVERIKVPMLVYHGEEDADVPFAQIGEFVGKARQVGVAIEYKSYRGEGHSNKKPENRKDVLDRTRAFFRQHLQHWNFRDNPCGRQVQ